MLSTKTLMPSTGNSLTATELTLDDDIGFGFFVRIASVRLFDESEPSAVTIPAQQRAVVWVKSLNVPHQIRVDPNPPVARAVVAKTPGLVVLPALD